jgi:processive 1,2-diacylglycerol beta-glucosyltransferase
VLNVDALAYTNNLFRDFYAGLYERIVQRTPDLWGLWYETSNEPWKTDNMRLMLDKIGLKDLVKYLQQEKPDIALCTHFLPAEIISHLLSRGELDTRLAVVVTDFYVHAMWLSKAFHHYFVAHDESRVHLNMLGFPLDRITASGIPIDPAFLDPGDPQPLRRRYGMEMQLPLILISAGTFGMESAEDVVRMLRRLQTPVQVAVICGHNADLQQRLRQFADHYQEAFPRFRIEGYTDKMHEWMAMADLLIGKPGGLTTAEAMAVGLPMVVHHPIPGQEEHNSDHLLENGAAIKCSEILTLHYKVDQVLQSPQRLPAMRTAARKLAAPRAAQRIIDKLVEQVGRFPHNMSISTG